MRYYTPPNLSLFATALWTATSARIFVLPFCLEACSSNHSIGLSDGSFTERGLIATTFLDAYHTPNWARLHQPRAWSPAILNDHSIEQYVQLTFFGGQFLVKNVAMQGSPLFDWWVTTFRISTSNDGEHFAKNTEVITYVLNRVVILVEWNVEGVFWMQISRRETIHIHLNDKQKCYAIRQ